MNPEELGEKIVTTLKTIFDPEIPVDIYELGLIYDVFVNEDNHVKVIMTLTTPNCPVAESMPLEVEEKVRSLNGSDVDEQNAHYKKILENSLGTKVNFIRSKNSTKISFVLKSKESLDSFINKLS